MRYGRVSLTGLLSGVLITAAIAGGAYALWWNLNYRTIERSEYSPPPQDDEFRLEDDALDTKNPVFDPELVDSRPLDGWRINASAAVIRLDCPLIKPDRDAKLLRLHRSYTEAVIAARQHGYDLLPSANLLDGVAKQFDDGLYAAIDLAAYRGQLDGVPAAPLLMADIFDQLPAGSVARPLLAAALKIAQQEVDLAAEQIAQRDQLLAEFDRNALRSEPISFYTWNEDLRELWRFSRFLQREFHPAERSIPDELATVLKAHPGLLERYRSLVGFFSSLSNPSRCRSLCDLIDDSSRDRQSIAILPPSTSREGELFDSAFPQGVPANVNLMNQLIRRIRSGQLDLRPTTSEGWYQHQVYALETLLLPSRGRENEKLLLTASYKRRLIEAFQALLTKRRETHARQMAAAGSAVAFADLQIRPRLRLEPCATFYLRTARAYAFVETLLEATAGPETLGRLHGLRADGVREPSLADELQMIRERFYGFYLLACEDIGMQPDLRDEELADPTAAGAVATEWLSQIEDDPDLAQDTRVAVPVFVDPSGQTRNWGTFGVRMAKLTAAYARPPMIRLEEGAGDWQQAERFQLDASHYVIAVDEFGEFTLPPGQIPSRSRFRAICDQHATKEAICAALEER